MNDVHEILLHLAPPIRLTIWLTEVFEAKRRKGEPVPAEYTAWLERWARIRSEMASEVDEVAADGWDRVKEMVF